MIRKRNWSVDCRKPENRWFIDLVKQGAVGIESTELDEEGFPLNENATNINKGLWLDLYEFFTDEELKRTSEKLWYDLENGRYDLVVDIGNHDDDFATRLGKSYADYINEFDCSEKRDFVVKYYDANALRLDYNRIAHDVMKENCVVFESTENWDNHVFVILHY